MNFESKAYKGIYNFKGDEKKVVVLGGAHHKVAYLPPPSPFLVKLPLFVGSKNKKW